MGYPFVQVSSCFFINERPAIFPGRFVEEKSPKDPGLSVHNVDSKGVGV